MINLLPNNIKESRLYGRRNRIMLSYILSFILTAILVEGVMLVSLRFIGSTEPNLRATISQNQTQITALEKDMQNLSSVVGRLNTAEKLYDSSIEFSKLIPKIGSILPKGAVLNGLSLTGGNTDPLSLDVDITSAELAPTLQRNLEDSDLFEAVDINSISAKSTTDIYKYSASISVSFTGSAKAKRKIAAAAAAVAAQKKAQSSSKNGGNK